MSMRVKQLLIEEWHELQHTSLMKLSMNGTDVCQLAFIRSGYFELWCNFRPTFTG